MAQTVKLKRTSVANRHATTSHIEVGELAFNSNDKSLFIRGDNDAIVTLHDENTLHIDHINDRVGIGTDNPGRPLDVVAATNILLELESTHAGGNARMIFSTNSGSNWNMGALTDGSFSLFDAVGGANSFIVETGAGGNTLVIDSNSRVGIGTAGPSEKLEVNGGNIRINNASGGSYFKAVQTSNTANAGLYMASGSSNWYTLVDTAGKYQIYDGDAAAIRVIVDGSGNVGIGTSTTSTAKLVVQGGDASDVLHLHGLTGTNTRGLKISLSNGGATNQIVNYDSMQANGIHVFKTAGTERMRIHDGGNVGIGTDDPDARLHVAHGTDSSDAIQISGGHTGRYLAIRSFTNNTLAGAGFFINASSSQGELRFQTTSNTKMTIATDGSVGIGTTSPTGAKLHVTGAIKGTDLIAHDNTGINLQTDEGTKRLVVADSGVITFNQAYSFPTSDGSANQVLQTDGSGNLSFATVQAGGGGTVSESFKNIAVSGQSNIVADAATDTLTFAAGAGMTITTNASSDTVTFAAGTDFQDSDGDTKIQVEESSDEDVIRFDTAGFERLIINSSGRIGIGHSAPNAQLHINAGTNSAVTIGDATNPALQIGGTTNYRFGVYTDNETAYIENKNGDDGIAFRVKTAGEAMRIDGGTGRVGIGEDQPDEALIVRGGLYASNQDGGIAIQSGHHDGNHWKSAFKIKSDASGVMRTVIDASSGSTSGGVNEAITINTSGSVGIGTATPAGGLHVANSFIRVDNSEGIAAKKVRSSYFSTSQNLTLETNSAASIVMDTGAVLIGTTASLHGSADLQIQGAAGNYARIMLKDQDSTNLNAFIDENGGNLILTSQNGTSHGTIAFKTYNGTDTLERMRVNSAGNIGIGTNSPQDTLHVVTDSTTTNDTVDVVRIEATSSGTPAIGFGPVIDFRGERAGASSDHMGKVGFVADVMTASRIDGAFIVETAIDGSPTERLRIRSNGNVGIGEASPSQKLQVNGNIRADGHYYVGGNIVINSSRALQNITTISSGEITSSGSGDQDLIINSTNSAKARVLLQENGTTKIFIENKANSVSGQFGIYSASASKYALLIDASGNTSLNGGTLTSGSISGTSLSIDTLSMNGSSIGASGNMTLDVAGDIILDADGGDVRLKDNGTEFLNLYAGTIERTGGSLNFDVAGNITLNADGSTISLNDDTINFGQFYQNASGALNIYAPTPDKDIVFLGNDGGSTVTALKLDMSAAGAATLNDRLYLSGTTANYITSDGNYLRNTTAYGTIQIGPGNAAHAHLLTDRTNFYFNKELQVDTGIIGSHNEDLTLRRAASTNHQLVLDSYMFKGTSGTNVGSFTALGGFVLNTALEDSGFHTYIPGIMTNAFAGGSNRVSVTTTINGSSASLDNNAFDYANTFAALSLSSTSDTVVITITNFGGLSYGQNYGIQFSGGSFRAQNVKIEVSTDGSSYTTILNGSNSPSSVFNQYHGGSGTAVSHVRYTLTNFIGTGPRIANIFGYNYGSNEEGYHHRLYANNVAYSDTTFVDNKKAKFGTGGDLEIYHTNPHAYIDNNNGSLYISSTNSVQIEDNGGNDMITAAAAGAVSLFYNGASKLSTSSTGIDVTGDANFYSGTGSNTVNIGRNSSERLTVSVTDQHVTLTADQDSDGNAIHDFVLNRTFDGSGGNNFKIQKAGADQLTIDTNGTVTIAGNLTVQGTTTTLNTATLDVEDKNITLNYHASNDTSGSADGAGITIQDAVNSNTDASLTWNAAGDKFIFSHKLRMFGTLELPDNVKLIAGDSEDLQIYHNGTDSIIADTGTGGLYLRGSNFISLQNAAGTETMIYAANDGAVQLKFNNDTKFATTNEGVEINDTYDISSENTNTSATTQVTIDQFTATAFRSCRYTIQVSNTTDTEFHTTELLLVHDGTTPGITEFGSIFTGAAAEATFDADISSGNVRLRATPASADSMTFKVVRHAITA